MRQIFFWVLLTLTLYVQLLPYYISRKVHFWNRRFRPCNSFHSWQGYDRINNSKLWDVIYYFCVSQLADLGWDNVIGTQDIRYEIYLPSRHWYVYCGNSRAISVLNTQNVWRKKKYNMFTVSYWVSFDLVIMLAHLFVRW